VSTYMYTVDAFIIRKVFPNRIAGHALLSWLLV
jgi:hypothetical protein